MLMNDRQLRRYTVELVRSVIADHALPERPTTGEVLSALHLPTPEFTDLGPERYGMRSGRQIIVSSRITNAERVEFTIFHEAVHILVDEDGEVIGQLHDHFYHDADDRGAHCALEDLCNVGAAEFILPSAAFSRSMAECAWRLRSLDAVATAFGSSLLAAAYQFAHYNPDPCTVAVCEAVCPAASEEPRLEVHAPGRGSSLIVTHTAFGEGAYPMCRQVPVPSDHLISHAWRNGTDLEGKAEGFFRNNRWKMACDIVCLRGRMYAAFYPKGRNFVGEHPSLFDL